MRIGVCDDEGFELERLMAMLGDWIKTQGRPVYLEQHLSAESFLDGMENHLYDVAFLDIEMPRINGLELARIIRRRDPSMTIIFVTHHKHYAFPAFSISDAKFLKKPVSQAECGRLMDCLVDVYEKRVNDVFHYQSDGQCSVVYKSEILYFNSARHYITMKLKDDDIRFRQNMAELEKILGAPHFYRCHKSFIVNLFHVRCIYKDRILMSNAEVVPLARSRWVEINNLYLRVRMRSDSVGDVYCYPSDDD